MVHIVRPIAFMATSLLGLCRFVKGLECVGTPRECSSQYWGGTCVGYNFLDCSVANARCYASGCQASGCTCAEVDAYGRQAYPGYGEYVRCVGTPVTSCSPPHISAFCYQINGCQWSHGPSSAPGRTYTEVEQALFNVCVDTMVTANADGDNFFTRDELESHAGEFTKALCPDVVPQHEYFNDDQYTEWFRRASCLLCMGVLDPFNANAPEGTGAQCGCPGVEGLTTTEVPINLSTQTPHELFKYCALLFGVALVQCLQPEPSCLEACNTEYALRSSKCVSTGAPDDIVNCLDTCNPPLYQCIEACDRPDGRKLRKAKVDQKLLTAAMKVMIKNEGK